MVALRETASPLADGGLYIVARRSGSVRALVHSDVVGTVSRLDHAVECIGHILQRCAPGQNLAVSIRIDRGPVDN